MKDPHAAEIRSVLILKADRLYADNLRQLVLTILPHATVKHTASIANAALALAKEPVDLLITGVGLSLDGDVLDLLSSHTGPRGRVRRVLVVTAHREGRALAALRTLPIDGVFDSAIESSEQFKAAVRVVISGKRYWSASVLDRMHRDHLGPNSLFRRLTGFEQLMLSILGDGSDDISAARELGLSPSTVSTVRRQLHRKLGVQHRGELVRVAAQHGFVRFTPGGVLRPGFTMLTAAYQSRKVHGEQVA
jgi:DNA-binding NarL/FixJ family response regulator